MFRWLESLLAPRADGLAHRSRVRSRLDLPCVRDVRDTLRRLRLFRDELDLYVMPGTGRVLLLEYQPGKERIAVGQRLLTRGLRSKRPMWDAQFMAQGFALLADMSPRAIDTGELFNHAEVVLSRTPKQVDIDHEAAVAVADGSVDQMMRAAAYSDRMKAEYKSDHHILFRHRKTFNGGLSQRVS